ncbi:MAG: protein translocase subunit SecD, partial [Bdellovibrionales bacterium]
MEGYRFRATVAILGVLWAVLWVFPNVVPVKKWMTDARINYGLDIQGGLQIVMGVDVEGVVAESTQRELRSIESVLAKENVVATLTAPNSKKGEIQIDVTSGTVEKMQKVMDDNYGTMFQVLNQAGNTVTYRYIDAYMLDYRSRIISQAIETIRNRIDEFGVAEPSIAQQGDDRIMIQLPGAANAEQAKQLINTTAKLDFQIVSRAISPDKLMEMVTAAEKVGGYSLDKMKYSEYIERLNSDLKSQIPADTV